MKYYSTEQKRANHEVIGKINETHKICQVCQVFLYVMPERSKTSIKDILHSSG